MALCFGRNTHGLFAVLALLSATACKKWNPVTPSASPAASASAAPQPTALSDASIKDAVTAELDKDSKIDHAGIEVSVEKGIVSLTGKVDNVLSMDRSTRIAEAVRGVRSVSNRVIVSPSERPDEDIQRDVQKALLYNAATANMPLHASVTGGVVTLRGAVQSRQEQDLAGRIAEGVRGVRLALNDLTVKKDPKWTDELVAHDVKNRLAWDVLVEHDPIEATVKNAAVTLSGNVGSAAEKSRAIGDAWVDGVSAVDATTLEVKWSDRPDKNLRTTTTRSDQDIATAIKDAAYYDPRVKAFNIVPSVTGGVATLNGTVTTLKAKMAAEALARNTVGVTSVVNRLVARSQQSVGDRVLERRVKEALVFDPIAETQGVVVSVKNGEVVLSGTVGTYFDSAEAYDVASRLAGVTNVDNQLHVLNQAVPYVYTAYLDPFTPYVEAWYVGSPRAVESDAAIQDRIKAEFTWSPFVYPQDVQVSVAQGKVTLTGTVRSFLERTAAVESAFEAGAVSVNDQLKVG